MPAQRSRLRPLRRSLPAATLPEILLLSNVRQPFALAVVAFKQNGRAACSAAAAARSNGAAPSRGAWADRGRAAAKGRRGGPDRRGEQDFEGAQRSVTSVISGTRVANCHLMGSCSCLAFWGGQWRLQAW